MGVLGFRGRPRPAVSVRSSLASGGLLAPLLMSTACSGGEPSSSTPPATTMMSVPGTGLMSAVSPSITPSPSRTITSAPAAVRFEQVASHTSSSVVGLSDPGYFDFNSDGELYLVNSGNDEVLVLDASGAVVRRWGQRGAAPGQFDFLRNPSDPSSALGGVAVAPDGTVYVVESGNRRVQHLDADGSSIAVWGEQGRGDGQFVEPIGVAVDHAGQV